MSIRLAIFDLDDTLLDTSRAVRAAREETLGAVFPQWTAARRRRGVALWRATTSLYRDQQLAPLLAIVAGLCGDRLPDALDIDALATGYARRQVDVVRPRAVIVAAARRLGEEGHTVAILSNGDRATQIGKLRTAGIADLVPGDRIVVCDGVVIPYKPDPSSILTLIGVVGAERAVLVGDRHTDVIAGRLAGIATVRIRSRCADIDWGAALRSMVRPDREVAARDCFAAVRDVLDEVP